MAEPAPTGSDALRWLDTNMVASADAPDEAFDWVFMLQPDDWAILEAAWRNRSAAWREACAYIVGESPLAPSQGILRLALADDDRAVAAQAAISICGQILEHPDKVQLDPAMVPRLQELKRVGGEMNEVDAVLRRSGMVG